MRADYFKAGPPWKAVFKDRKGFIYQTMIRSESPPKYYTFPNVFNLKEVPDLKLKHQFKLTGVFGNVARYEEI